MNFVIDQWNQGYIKTYSTHNEGKSVVAGIFIRTLKYNFFLIYKYMTSVSKSVYSDKLDDIKLINTLIHIIAQLKWSLFM